VEVPVLKHLSSYMMHLQRPPSLSHLFLRQEAATPERSPQISLDPPSPVVDQSSPQQLADPPSPVHEMSANLSTPLLEILEDPATPVLGLTTTPPKTLVLHFTDEEGT